MLSNKVEAEILHTGTDSYRRTFSICVLCTAAAAAAACEEFKL